MRTLTDAEQQWQEQAFESFFNMVKAPDGDFDAIAQLSSTLNDPDSLKIMVEFLSQHSQGKQALLSRPRLGNWETQLTDLRNSLNIIH
ncbi:MAG: hypothetical protein ACRC80_02035 [Waterburya sp.]